MRVVCGVQKSWVVLALLHAMTPLCAQTGTSACDLDVDAGEDIVLCNGAIGQLNGSASGNITKITWSPAIGLDDPTVLTPTVDVAQTTTYTLRVEGESDNLIPNGDFENGNIDPATTTMGYLDPNSFPTGPVGTYTVSSVFQITGVPNICTPYEGQYMMMVHGGQNSMWCYTVNVQPNTDYKFRGYFMGADFAGIVEMVDVEVTINGQSIGSVGGVTICTWEELSATWNSGPNVTAQICINGTGGNNAWTAFDALEFVECCAEEDQVTVYVEEVEAFTPLVPPITCIFPQAQIDGGRYSRGNIVSYQWEALDGEIVKGQSDPVVTVGKPGIYVLHVTGQYGCMDTDTVEVEGNNQPPPLSVDALPLTCRRDTGFIFAEAEGDELRYRWSGPDSFVSTYARDTVFHGGKYYLTVEDKYHCKSIDSVEVKDLRLQKSYTLQIDSFRCTRDTATVRIVGDSLLVSTTWELRDTILRDLYEIAVVGDDTIYTTIVDRGGCIWHDTVVLMDTFLRPEVQLSTNGLSCDSPQAWIYLNSTVPVRSVIVVYPDGGADTFRSFNLQRIPTRRGGLHFLLLAFDRACPIRQRIKVPLWDSLPRFQLIGDTLNCARRKAWLRVDGDSTYRVRWSGPGFSDAYGHALEITRGGWYYVEVENAAHCRVRDSIFVFEDTTAPRIDLPDQLVLNCYSPVDTIILNYPDSAHTSIEWYTPGGQRYGRKDTIAIDQSGEWVVHLRASNGCAVQDTLWVFYDTSRPRPAVELQTINCIHRRAEVRIVSEHIDQWLWKGPNDTSYRSGDSVWTSTSGGKVWYRLRYRNGCWREDSLLIGVDTLPPILTLYEDSLTCQRDTIALRADIRGSWDSLLWTGPNGFRSEELHPKVSSEGTYGLQVYGTNGCTAEASTRVYRTGEVPTAELRYRGWLDCHTRQDTLRVNNPQPGWKYRWTLPNGATVEDGPQLIVADSGRYELVVVDASGCTAQYSAIVQLDTTAPRIQWDVDTLTCVDTMDLIQIVHGDTDVVKFSWWFPSGDVYYGKLPVVFERGGSYVVAYTSDNGCTHRDTLVVPEDRAIPSLSAMDDSLGCTVDSVLLRFHTDIDHYELQWIYGGRVIGRTNRVYAYRPGTYVLMLTNTRNGCTAIDTAYIAPPYPIQGVELSTDFDCATELYLVELQSITGGTGPYGIRINGQSLPWKSQPWHVTSGPNIIQLIDSKGCVYDTVVALDSIAPLRIALLDSVVVDYGTEVRLVAQVNRSQKELHQISWHPFDGLSCVDCLDPTLRATRGASYVCEIVDVYGCTDSAIVYIRVRVPQKVYFPNVLHASPSAINNRWKPLLPKGQSGWIEALDIFDRWGERVYTIRSVSVEEFAGWDGRFHGNTLPAGVYVYHLRLRLAGQEDTKTYLGQITLIR